MKTPIHICWLRRDLRLHDQAALFEALTSGPTVALFIFDRDILDRLEDRDDARVQFIHQTLNALGAAIAAAGGTLITRYGRPMDVWKSLLEEFPIAAVYANHDYEPYAIQRDQDIKTLLNQRGIGFHTFKDQVIFEKDEVLSATGKPYTVYTPYSKTWLKKLENSYYLKSYPTEKYFHHWHSMPLHHGVVPLEAMGFKTVPTSFPSVVPPVERIKKYEETRNYPALDATSHLGIHLRFGTLSVRQLAAQTAELSHTYLKELIWREFFAQILWHFPKVVNHAFKPAYDQIPWRQAPEDFAAWCEGKTGYPLVDAGMRELAATGFMHNRVRMITGSFLTKHLLIDWRLGEAWFARKLLDFDLASNNGNWQWVAGTGCDAAPYFRVFNPDSQAETFDNKAAYIAKWVPEYTSLSYQSHRIVNHAFARQRALDTYKMALKGEPDPNGQP